MALPTTTGTGVLGTNLSTGLNTTGGLSATGPAAPAGTVTPGSQPSGNLMIGNAPPSVNTVTQQQTAAPQFYTDYLQNLAKLGQTGVTQGGVAGLSDLQNQAISAAPNVAKAQDPFLTQASNLLANSAQTAPSQISQYMNPYTTNVVDEISRLGNRQIQEQLAPNATAAAVGTGQFGSQRGQQVLGNTLRDAYANILGQQSQALNTGYTNSMNAASNDLNRQLQAGQTAGQLGQIASGTNIAGLNALNAIGKEQQTQAQNELNYPMTAATNYAQLLKNYTMPTATTQSYSGPMAGLTYSPSPLAQIAALMQAAGTASGQSPEIKQLLGSVTTPVAGLINKGAGAVSNALGKGYDLGSKALSNIFSGTSAIATSQTGLPAGPNAPAEVQDANGNVKDGYYQDEMGNWINLSNPSVPVGGTTPTPPVPDYVDPNPPAEPEYDMSAP
jgi:hypothetical protein